MSEAVYRPQLHTRLRLMRSVSPTPTAVPANLTNICSLYWEVEKSRRSCSGDRVSTPGRRPHPQGMWTSHHPSPSSWPFSDSLTFTHTPTHIHTCTHDHTSPDLNPTTVISHLPRDAGDWGEKASRRCEVRCSSAEHTLQKHIGTLCWIIHAALCHLSNNMVHTHAHTHILFLSYLL